MTNAQQVLSQNSLSTIDLSVDLAASGNDLRMQLFATGDPGANTHWLKQIRIAVHIDGDGNRRSVTSQSRHSQEVRTSVVTYHTCDRKSCLGCNTLKLQSLCYAAQQCAVTSCIGTIVNQNRPLCNAGLLLKSYTEGTLSMVLGAWLIFTETYTTTLGNIGSVLSNQGKYSEALEKHQQCLAIQMKVLDPEHLWVATSLNDIGSVLSNQGKYREALEKYQQCLAIQMKALGPEHADVVATRSAIVKLRKAMKM